MNCCKVYWYWYCLSSKTLNALMNAGWNWHLMGGPYRERWLMVGQSWLTLYQHCQNKCWYSCGQIILPQEDQASYNSCHPSHCFQCRYSLIWDIRLHVIIVIPVIVFGISIHCYKIRFPIILEICVIVFSISIHCYEIMPEVEDGEINGYNWWQLQLIVVWLMAIVTFLVCHCCVIVWVRCTINWYKMRCHKGGRSAHCKHF